MDRAAAQWRKFRKRTKRNDKNNKENNPVSPPIDNYRYRWDGWIQNVVPVQCYLLRDRRCLSPPSLPVWTTDDLSLKRPSFAIRSPKRRQAGPPAPLYQHQPIKDETNVTLSWRCQILVLILEEAVFTLSASWTSQICSPVAGLYVGKTFPLTESCHSLLMKIWRTQINSRHTTIK